MQYLAKKPRKPSASADLGTAVHEQSERHLRGEGFDFSTPYKKRAAEIALLGVPYLPAPLTPGMRVENRLIGAPPTDARDFSFEASNEIVYRGRMDVTVPDSSVVPGLWGGAPAIIDHKTSSNIALYALSEEDLHTDVQAVIYAYYLMSMYRSPVADLQWNYLPTKGPKVAQPRRMRVYSPRVVEEFEKIQVSSVEIAATYHRRPDPLDLPPCNEFAGTGDRLRRDPCEWFGGCSFKQFCTDVFDPLGFPKRRLPMINGTAEGQSRIDALTGAAQAVDPAYAAWRAQGNAAPADPAYAGVEAAYQASLAPAAPPPPPPALPAGITNAPPGWTPPPFLTAPAAAPAPPAINPPEFQAAPTLEQRAAVLTPAPKEAKKTRTRRTNEQIAADKAIAPKEFTLYVVEADGTLTTEVIVAAAVFVR